MQYGAFAESYTISYNANLNEAQLHLLSLKLDKAEHLILSESKKSPENIACDFLLNYVYYFRVLTSQQEEHLDALKKQVDITIKKINKLSDKHGLKKVMLAEVYLQEAFAKVLFEEYLGAALLIRTANKLLVQNKKQFPNLVANDKNLAVFEALGGTLPESYQWIAQFAGMKTSFNSGLEKLLEYIKNGKLNKQTDLDIEQAKMLYVLLICQYSDEKEKALAFCKQHFNQTQNNLYHVFMVAYTALDAKKPEIAKKAIESFENTKEYTPFYYIDYAYAKAKMYLEESDAAVWFKRYVTFYKGKLLVNDSYRKLSWLACLENDFKTYKVYFYLSIKNKSKLNEEDLFLLELIKQSKMPEPKLLQSRILFDGGQYPEALSILNGIEKQTLKYERDKIELYYRKGRIYFELNKYQEAIDAFERCVRINEKNNSYMIPYATYYIGLAQLKLGKTDLAEKTFNKTLSFSNYQYETTLKQKVKIALSMHGQAFPF